MSNEVGKVKTPFLVFFLTTILLLFATTGVFAKPNNLAARIEGQVFDESHKPLENVYVELLNETNSMMANKKTDGSGRFTFSGIASIGRFQVKVLPIGKDLMGETREVEITGGLSGGSNDVIFVEFVLHPDKRFAKPVPEKPPEAVFVQEIPPEAKRAYALGVGFLDKNDPSGATDLERAIAMFPTYFDALSRLGKEYLIRSDFEKAYPYLIRAIDVNPRSYSSFYGLGYAFYKLNKIPAGLKAAQACTILSPESDSARLLYGTLLRLDINFPEAEKELVKARTLSKKPNPEIHWQLSLLFNRMKRNKETVTELETFLKLSPDTPDRKKISKK